VGVEMDLGFEGVEGIEADLVADAGDEADVEGAAVEVAGEVGRKPRLATPGRILESRTTWTA
jgi:hypothetical protein